MEKKLSGINGVVFRSIANSYRQLAFAFFRP